MTETLKIQIPIYNDTLFVFFGNPKEATMLLLKDGLIEREADSFRPSDGADGYFQYFSESGIYLLWARKIPENVKDYGVLVHEIMHFVISFLGERGMEMNAGSEEAYTYLAQYVFCEIDNYIVTELEKHRDITLS